MGQALYRKYRSKRLHEIVGQEHITKTLETALKQHRVAHAYLFTGPRGVGKTSIARILAHEINELPYTDESMHMDIIEIDAASNRRIDEIRDLRDKVHVAPTSAKYKVYIIDEVHMLTREAFNALLKTLEEPPAHVIFILATTEAHKVPVTIISRTQRFQFKSVDLVEVAAHLKTIATAEHITIDDDALRLIAQYGEGSFRDSISLLDQAAASAESITAQNIQRLIGIAPDSLIEDIINAISKGDTALAVRQIAQARAQGIAATELAKQLGAALRAKLLDTKTTPLQAYITAIRELAAISASTNQWLSLELCALEAIAQLHRQAMPKRTNSVATPAHASLEQPSSKEESPPVSTQVPQEQPASEIEPTPPTEAVPSEIHESDALWSATLEDVRDNYNTLYAVLRMAKPIFEGNSLTLMFKFPFHQKRVSESKHIATIVETLQKFSKQTYEVICLSEDKVEPASNDNKTSTSSANHLEAVSAIFGDAQLVEN